MHTPFTEPRTRTNWMGATPSEAQIALYSAEDRASRFSAPAFVCFAIDDTTVPIANGRMYAKALREQNVPVLVHEAPGGGHALDFCTGPRWNAMLDSAWQFMQQQRLAN